MILLKLAMMPWLRSFPAFFSGL